MIAKKARRMKAWWKLKVKLSGMIVNSNEGSAILARERH